MKTRVFPSILVAASVFSLYSIPPVDWERVGENWGNSFQHSKDGVKHLTGKIVNESLRLYGHVKLDDVIIKKYFTCYGYAELNTVTVQGVTTMYGPMIAQNSTFTDVDIRCYNEAIGKGTVSLNKCTLNKITLNGRLETKNTTIKQIITFAPDTVLSHSTVGDINVMNKALPKNEKAVVELHNTIVEGSITFSQKGGTVICKGSSEVRGTITNGTIIKE